jgi:serine/threonine protein phosphatase PrpC
MCCIVGAEPGLERAPVPVTFRGRSGENPQYCRVDVGILIVGSATLAVALIGLARTRRPAPARETIKPAKPRARTTPQKRPPRPAPVAPSTAPDDDVDITVITSFPKDLLAEAKRREELVSSGRSSSPTISILAGGGDFGTEISRVGISYEGEAELDEVTSPVVRILISAAGDSDRGRLRARNEDSLLVMPEYSLYAVADGMGGHAGGEVASALAVDILRDAFERGAFEARTESETPVPRRGRELACAIQMANEAIHTLGSSDQSLANMGTTVIAARFSPNKQRVYIGHVGDSRCYRLRGQRLRQLTKDHTMGSLGVMGPRAGDLFQAVGVRPTLHIDLIVDKPREEDIYLLCSDGLSKMVKDEEIAEILSQEQDLEAAVYGLIELANDRGGRDNTTVILVKVVERLRKFAS